MRHKKVEMGALGGTNQVVVWNQSN